MVLGRIGPDDDVTSEFLHSLKVAVTAAEPHPPSGRRQRMRDRAAQWSTLLVPKPARTTSEQMASSFDALAEPKPASACGLCITNVLQPLAARSRASSQVAT
jgi:hypothetical protein